MTTAHPLQLHLFDANPDLEAIPVERLLRLTGELLREAAQGEIPQDEAPAATEKVNE